MLQSPPQIIRLCSFEYRLSGSVTISVSSTTLASPTIANPIRITQQPVFTSSDLHKCDYIYDILLNNSISYKNKIILINNVIRKYKWCYISSKEQLLSFIYRIIDIYKYYIKQTDIFVNYNLYKELSNKIIQIDNYIAKITM